MKKIIILLFISIFVVSCTDDKIVSPEVEVKEVEIKSEQINEIEQILEDEIKNINKDTNEEENTIEIKNNENISEEEKKIMERSITEDEVSAITVDENKLEEEVNGLLDGLIDSLDNYDK